MATNRTIFANTLYSSELYQIYVTRNDSPKEIVTLLDMPFGDLKKARTFAKRVFDIDSSQWTRNLINQIRVKALRRATRYPNARKFGYDVDDYERLFSKVVGNHAYIGAPKDKVFIRLYIVDEVNVICDDRDAEKLEKFLGRFI